MRKFLILAFIGSSLVACNSQETSSSVKVVDSNDMTLKLESGIYSESASISDARASVTVDKTGEVFYRLQADIKLGDLGQMNLFRLQRTLQMNPRFVVYSTFKNMETDSTVSYQERGLTLAKITKASESEAGLISLRVSHFATGLDAKIVISEGEKGLVNVESIDINGTAKIALPDPQARQISYYEEVPYWPYSILKTETMKLFGLLEGKLSVKKVK